MVTHDLDYLSYAKTAVQIFDGEVVGVFRGKDKSKIEKSIKKRKQYAGDDKSAVKQSVKEKKETNTDADKTSSEDTANEDKSKNKKK